MRYLLYNPFSGKGEQAREYAESYSALVNMPTQVIDIATVKSVKSFFEDLGKDDDVVIFGGDGSLNKIINELQEIKIENDLYYFPCGTGNDFARDIGASQTSAPIIINEYIKDLPTVTVEGNRSKFINGVGFGVDGYCCEIGDMLKSKNKIPNYASIAVKGVLFHFKPVNATVCVDGKRMDFKKVWIAPTMFGRFYGGGMMPTPAQDRKAAEKKVSLMLFHGTGKLRTLMLFPSIFKGEHIKHKKNVAVLQGENITVTFDRPTSLQIDGETILNVRSYSVEA